MKLYALKLFNLSLPYVGYISMLEQMSLLNSVSLNVWIYYDLFNPFPYWGTSRIFPIKNVVIIIYIYIAFKFCMIIISAGYSLRN